MSVEHGHQLITMRIGDNPAHQFNTNIMHETSTLETMHNLCPWKDIRSSLSLQKNFSLHASFFFIKRLAFYCLITFIVKSWLQSNSSTIKSFSSLWRFCFISTRLTYRPRITFQVLQWPSWVVIHQSRPNYISIIACGYIYEVFAVLHIINNVHNVSYITENMITQPLNSIYFFHANTQCIFERFILHDFLWCANIRCSGHFPLSTAIYVCGDEVGSLNYTVGLLIAHSLMLQMTRHFNIRVHKHFSTHLINNLLQYSRHLQNAKAFLFNVE